ncbi:MAG TPA: hypothetical protein VMT95_02105 [Candidatus Binatia bacterium]|nr:hypothetical protein [Candidatus Binatia bacterium]
MNVLLIGLLAFACLFGGALLGMRLRNALPHHHLSGESAKLLELGLAIVGTMAGLVLGLLVASATSAYNAQRSELLDVSSKIIVLDRILKHYGPEANPPRAALRVAVERTLYRIWPQQRAGIPELDPSAEGAETILDQIEDLAPTNDAQRSLKSEAVGLSLTLGQIRWLMYEQTGSSLSMPLLVLLIFWFTITFVGFGLFSPPNPTVVVALALCSLAVSGAIFVMLEMYTPFQGLVQIPSAPLREALAHLQ